MPCICDDYNSSSGCRKRQCPFAHTCRSCRQNNCPPDCSARNSSRAPVRLTPAPPTPPASSGGGGGGNSGKGNHGKKGGGKRRSWEREDHPPFLVSDSDTEPCEAGHIAVQDPYFPLEAVGGPSSSSHAHPRKFRVLHLFSGPSSRKDSLSAYLRAVGIETFDCDTVNLDDVDQDILDDSTWLRIKARLQDRYYDFVFAGPPCRTLSASRWCRPRTSSSQ